MPNYGPGCHTRGQGGTRGSRGAPGGARGVQATPGAKMSDKTVKYSKPWFKVSKVCPDPTGVVFIHLGPFGCSTTAIFSESEENFYVAIFPAHPVQFF